MGQRLPPVKPILPLGLVPQVVMWSPEERDRPSTQPLGHKHFFFLMYHPLGQRPTVFVSCGKGRL